MIKVVYMGTPDIAVKSLQELHNNSEIEVLAVVTQIDRPKGRGNKLTPPPVKVCAIENNIPCFQTERISRDEELKAKLKDMQPDFFVTFAFGQILSQEVLDIPKFATVNLHASLLPKYRGANPIQRCIYNGDCKTGITTMLTVLELDAGDICECDEIEITENMTNIELKDIISEKSPALLCSTLKGLYYGDLKPVKQAEDGVTIAKKFQKTDGEIDWNRTAKEIHNQVRSMVDFPTANTFICGKNVKIIESKVVSFEKTNKQIAEVVNVSKNGIEINTSEGVVLITKVKPESKGVMAAYDFANGAKIKAGIVIGE